MFSRRLVLLAGMASSILPLSASAIQIPVRNQSEWEQMVESMSLDQLKAKYSHMMRLCDAEHYRVVEASGPLHEHWFYRMRQQVYRRIIKLRYGIENPDDPLNPFHFPALS
jgi:hypothetical protein